MLPRWDDRERFQLIFIKNAFFTERGRTNTILCVAELNDFIPLADV